MQTDAFTSRAFTNAVLSQTLATCFLALRHEGVPTSAVGIPSSWIWLYIYIYMMLYKEAAKRNIHPIGKTSQLKKYKKKINTHTYLSSKTR